MLTFINWISVWAIPVIIAFIPLYAFAKKVPVYES
ncbi:spore maturation protein, partial [Escherichia coli]|nr:spore maturation protein [Escherichia coli]